MVPLVEYVQQVLFVDRQAHVGIDEDGGGASSIQAVLHYHLAGGVGERTVQASDVSHSRGTARPAHLRISGRKLEVGLEVWLYAFIPKPMAIRAVVKPGVAQAYDSRLLFRAVR